MFFLYRVNSNNHDLVRQTSIAGILADRIATTAESSKPNKDSRMPWEFPGPDLCHEAVDALHIKEDAASCKVVADATYTQDTALILEINHIWGLSYPEWSPMLLRMSALFDDMRPKGRSTPIEHFRIESPKEEFVHEFLYLQWGHSGGRSRNFGRSGFTNAALLWPEALEHLLDRIGFTRV